MQLIMTESHELREFDIESMGEDDSVDEACLKTVTFSSYQQSRSRCFVQQKIFQIRATCRFVL